MQINIKRCLSIVIIVILIIFIIPSCVEECFSNQDDPKLWELREKIAPLFDKSVKHKGVLEVINNRDVLNEISLFKGDKSYTINKEKVYLCLKNKDGEYYSLNNLLYVLLHEISHVLSTTIGHDKNFNNIFDAILKKASEMKIYDPKIPMDQNYCPD